MCNEAIVFILVLIFWPFILFTICIFLVVRDWWRYHPSPRKFRCRLLGHDYHNGAAQDLHVWIDGQSYLFDFCQRCWTEQNRRPEMQYKLMRIAISNETAKRMASDGWTVQMVAKSKIEDLWKYSFHNEVSKTWIKNAIRLTQENLSGDQHA